MFPPFRHNHMPGCNWGWMAAATPTLQMETLRPDAHCVLLRWELTKGFFNILVALVQCQGLRGSGRNTLVLGGGGCQDGVSILGRNQGQKSNLEAEGTPH